VGAYLLGWMHGGARGATGGDFAAIDVPDHWLLPDLLTAADLAAVLNVDERTVRNHAIYSWQSICGGRKLAELPARLPLRGSLILRRSDDGEPWVTPAGSCVAIVGRPAKSQRGRPRAGEGWRFRLVSADWCPSRSWFAVPDWVLLEDSAHAPGIAD